MVDVDHRMSLMRDESFGPVVGIMAVDDDEQAIALMNDSEFGLTASVWTQDLARGEALARRLQCGVALVNNHAITGILPETPWTGVKDTGSGVTNSRSAPLQATARYFSTNN